uniref:Ribosomal protein S10 n=1 Tax=Nitzschia sp. IriIs04 TaxID=1444690 RepID=A0A0S3QPM4_9STRA|nr:ribosomal protein S10 [Nitzschia sp. IriIs04]BAT70284.1 ribosomal protein S10 [Nitzschia sp. IriIs04]
MNFKKIKIKLEAFEYSALYLSEKKFINTILKNSLILARLSIINLPVEKKIYCVLRSPHTDKDSREHFEMKKHKKIIYIFYKSNLSIINLLQNTDLKPGVSCSIESF